VSVRITPEVAGPTASDDDVVPFYERLGFARVNGMVLRRPEVLR
jgi:hypothetical protein